jgi:hypothetical protein
MVGLSGLWMPIVLSAVLVFVASSLIHMVLGWHKGEYAQPPGEQAIADAIRAAKVPPGEYIMPYAGDMKTMSTPEFKARLEQGPNVLMTVHPPGASGMGKMLALWFVYSLVVSVFAAYVAGRALGQGADYLHVFRFAGVTAFAGYGLAHWQYWVWWSKSTRSTITNTLDALIYALLTAGAFGWLWPR